MTKISNLYSLTNYITANSSGSISIAAPSSGFALEVLGTGRYSGALSGSSATFTGALVGTSATFTGALSGSSALFTSNINISGSATSGLVLQNSAGGESPNVTFVTPVNRYNIDANAIGTLRFFTENIDGSGGVVRASIDSSGSTTFSSTVTTGGQLALTSGFGTSTSAISIYNNTASNASNIAQIDFRVNNTFGGNERIASITALNPNAGGNNGGALVFSVSANGTATTPTEDMRITQNGNVGIGTTDATHKLVLQNGTSEVGIRLTDGTNNSYFAHAASNGNFANGSITGDAVVRGSNGISLAPNNGASTTLRIASDGAATFSSTVTATRLTANADNSGLIVDVASRHGFMKYLNYGTGVVGRNTDTDGSISTWLGRFSGSITSPNAVFQDLVITNAGNIGIGTTAPGGTYGKLSVAGGIRIFDDNNAKLEIGRYSSGAANSYIKLGANSNSLRITNNTDVADVFIINNNSSLIQNGVNVRLTKTGGTSVTFTLTLGSIGAWTPGYATIRVSGTRGGLQEHYAAMYFLKLVYFQSSNVTTVNNVSGDTGSASIAVTTAFTSGNTIMTITISDVGASTDYMIADIDGSFQTGVGSIT